MKRFAVKVSAELHAEIKALGKQQEVLDSALEQFIYGVKGSRSKSLLSCAVGTIQRLCFADVYKFTCNVKADGMPIRE